MKGQSLLVMANKNALNSFGVPKFRRFLIVLLEESLEISVTVEEINIYI